MALHKFLLYLSLCLFVLSSCREKKHPPAVDPWADTRKAYAFRDKQNDSAYYYFNRIATTSKDSLQIAVAYNVMGGIQSDAGDDYGNQESQTLSLKFLNEKNPAHEPYLASDYNELGMASFNLKRYDEAIGFYRRSFALTTDTALRALSLNNQGNAYQDKASYNTAIELYEAAIRLVGTKGRDYPRILTNLAVTRWLKDSLYNAVPELLLALQIRRGQRDRWGENSSYGHLADFYMARRRDSALYYTNRQWTVANQINSPNDRLGALAKLIRLDPGWNAAKYFDTYHRLSDSIQTARSTAKNQFALIRYNVERSKAENLRLQKDNTENKYQLLIRNILLLAGFVVLAAGMISGLAWYRSYKKRKEQEKQEAILQTWRKASKDVHDSLSNDIYVLMKKIKHDLVLDRDELKVQSEAIYERSRKLSHQLQPESLELFRTRVRELLESFGTDQTKVSLVGNSTAFWQNVSPATRHELKLLLREFMVNMEKHSRATNVVVKFDNRDDSGIITYMDDGVGINGGTRLKNTETRINAIRGRITFGTNDGKGLKVELSFPFA